MDRPDLIEQWAEDHYRQEPEAHYRDDHKGPGEYLEAWIRSESCHNSLKLWIGDDGQLCMQVCDFDGHELIEAKDIDYAADALFKREAPRG